MAQKVITQLIDDIDGRELKEGEGETVTFSLDGTTYELDLSRKNADKMRGVFEEHIAAGRKVSGSRGKRGSSVPTSSASGPKASDVREWAMAQGLDVPARGRIPAAVRQQYDVAH